LQALKAAFLCTNAISSYLIGNGDPDASDSNGTIDTLHQHIFRPRFYSPLAGPGQPTVAQWMSDFVGGKLEQVGPGPTPKLPARSVRLRATKLPRRATSPHRRSD